MAFAPVKKLVEEIGRGRMVIMVDGPERENEGDLLMAAHMASAESITFMAKSGSGLICAPRCSRFMVSEAPPPTDEDRWTGSL